MEGAVERPERASAGRGGRVRRVLAVGATLPLVALLTGVVAFAYFSSSGSGTGTAAVGTLAAPSGVSGSASGSTVTVSWTPSAGVPTPTGYYVTRSNGGPAVAACGSAPGGPYFSSPCSDTGVPDGTYSYTVTAVYHSWTAAGTPSAQVTVSAAATKLVFTTSPQTTTAGVTGGTITVQRQNAASSPVTAGTTSVDLGSGSGGGIFRDATDTSNITTVSILPGSSSASFKYKDTVAGAATITASDAAAVLTSATQQATVTPANAATLTVAGYPSSTVAGVAHSFSLTARDAFGNTATGYLGTVHFANTNDVAATLPADYAFLAGDAGTKSFSATLKTVLGGTKTLSATDTVMATITGSETGISVTPAGAVSLEVGGYPSPTVAGVSHAFTVTARDTYGNTDSNYAGTVALTASNDAQVVLPMSSTLFAGTGTFSATFKTVAGGTKTLSATDTVTASVTGSQSSIAVTADTATTLAFTTQPGSATAGAAFGIQPVVKTQDAFGNDSTTGLATSRNVTVSIASGTGTLQGTATVDIGTSAGNGTASFAGLRIDTFGAKTLQATAAAASPTLTQATSSTFTVAQGTQTITFGVLAGKTFDQGPVTVSGSASSGLAVAYASTTTAVCTVGSSSGVVSFVAVGTCSITASQAGDSNWSAATPVTQSFAIGKGNQSITFTQPSNVRFDQASTVSASASSALAVSFSSVTASVCTVGAATGVVTYVSVGTCTINADQAGNTNWNAGTQVQRSFTIGKGNQSITFTQPSNVRFDQATTVSASTSSALAVSFSSVTASVCTVGAATGVVTYVSVGTCTINADQAGTTNWNAATQVQRSFTISKGNQTISFTSTAPTTANVGTTYTATATATAGLAASLTIDATATSVCSISAGVVTFNATGTCVIDANQAGNSNWNAAAQAQQSITVVLVVGLGIVKVGGTGITVSCGTPAASYTCSVTGTGNGGSVTFYVTFVDPAGTPTAYSASASTITESGQNSGTVQILGGQSSSSPGTLSAGHTGNSTKTSTLTFGSFTLTINVSS